jgi:hypothetical protein
MYIYGGIMKIYQFIKRHIHLAKKVLFVILFIPVITQQFLSSLTLVERFVLPLYSVIFLVVGYFGLKLVLGVQFKLKIASNMLLSLMCDFFFFSGLFALVFMFPISLIPVTNFDDAFSCFSIYTLFGTLTAAYGIKDKHFLNASV